MKAALALIRILVVVHAVVADTSTTPFDDFFPEERDALRQLRDVVNSTANLHHNWTGPPCFQDQSQWVGITCSNWHVTHLVLEGINLTGSLPPAFLQNITFLTILSFKGNSLYGTLPNLTNLAYLQVVRLAHNSFSGSIPSEYAELPKLTKFELQGNNIDGPIPPFDQQTLTDFNVSYNRLEGPIPKTSILQSFPDSSYEHNSGLCGTPLRIPCPVSPPLPVPSPGAQPGKKESLQVWNIVLIAAAAALIPFSVMLVFLCYYRRVQGKITQAEQEPESRGIGRVPVSWSTRLSIIKDVAKGLSFLHQFLASHKVPHANLKSSNVLIQRIDQNQYRSKLTEFGFLPLLPSRKSSELLAIQKSPEFGQGKKLTHKADVYCFGIVLLEVITGKIPGGLSDEGEHHDLSNWVRMVVQSDWSTDILDMEIVAAKDGYEEMLRLTELALECTDTAPERRPKMCQVLRRIEELEKTSHDQQRES
ncbi:hypothetical protein RJ639_025663 [Escallonia herrerae]|uniref:Protein kinase domain-containing protein n=1 Tax=Escallonia herrerae TaxID=1293975 RepID=A0AA89ACG8_9ASTE|nr:hypothetical protein RJ639_025663 [Escallonia herrerae]